MRIGIDCLSLQSDSKFRGIGRYSKNLLDEILRTKSNEYILYVYDGYPTDLIPKQNCDWCLVWPGSDNFMTGLYNCIKGNSDNLDILLLLSPWESYVPSGCGIPKIMAIVYDLIPLIFKDEYLKDEWFRDYYFRYLNAISEYDHLLTLSESARDDIIRLLKVSRRKVSVIGGATDPNFTYGVNDLVEFPATINKPYFLHVGGDDIRKGGERVLKAFSLLPNKDDVQLVFSYGADEPHKQRMRAIAKIFNIPEDSFIFMDYTSDATIKQLYQNCIATIFPSAYEGFGLPILESMVCGAPVIAGNNSSQIELAGEVGCLVDHNDVDEISKKMFILSTDKELNLFMREQSKEYSSQYQFSWESVVNKFFEAVVKPVLPKLAVFSPVPPIPSGISDYIVGLLEHLEEFFDITIYIDGNDGYVPDPSVKWRCRPHNDFSPANTDYILYQMGNSEYHIYMYPYILKYPGVVTLHDFCLAGFHNNYDWTHDGHYKKQVELAGEEYTEEISWAPEGRVVECIKRGLFLNDEVIDVSRAVITHNKDFAINNKGTVKYAPFPRKLNTVNSVNRDVVLNIVVPGWLSDTKLNLLTLESFSKIKNKGAAQLIFAGDGKDEHLRKFCEENLLENSVQFKGWLTKEEYGNIINMADIGVTLRASPTNGETSAAMFDLLAAGVPTIVSNVGTFREIPNDVVFMVNNKVCEITNLIDELIEDKQRREWVGKMGRQYVAYYHNPRSTAKIYKEVIMGELK